MKSFIIDIAIIVICIVTLVGIYFICLGVQNAKIDNILNDEFKIAEVISTVSGNNHKEYTVFVVYKEDGTKYTLPKINTSYVREYHEGDTLPVTIRNYKDGSYDIEVDKSKLD